MKKLLFLAVMLTTGVLSQSAFAGGAWTLTTFDKGKAFVMPDHWLSGGSLGIDRNLSLTSGGGDPFNQLKAGSAISWTLPEPQDLYELSLYFTDANCTGLAFDGIQVKYEGSEDFALLENTAMTYEFSAPNGKPQLLTFKDESGPFVRRVVAIKIVLTQANTAWYGTRVYESVLTGIGSDSEGAEWKFCECSADEFVRADDAILPTNEELVASTSGFNAKEYDADMATGVDRQNTNAYVWKFKRPIDVRMIEMFSNGQDSNTGRFFIDGVYVLSQKESDEWRRAGGSAYSLWGVGGFVQRAQFVSMASKYALKGVYGVKVVWHANTNTSWVPVRMAEIQLCGQKSSPGLMLLIR